MPYTQKEKRKSNKEILKKAKKLCLKITMVKIQKGENE